MVEPQSNPGRGIAKWWRRLLVAATILVVLVGIALFSLGRYLRAAVLAEDLEILLNDALVEATGGLYTVQLEGIEWGSGAVSLRLDGVSLMLDREVLAAADAAGTLPEVIFQLQHATVDVAGIDLWSLLRGDGFRAYSLTIDQPLLQVSGLEEILSPKKTAAEDSAEAEAQDPEQASAAEPEPAARGEARKLRIWRVQLMDAELESYRRQDADTGDIADTFELFESFRDVDFEIDDLDLGDPTGRLLFAEDVAVRIGEYYYLWPDGLHEERHGPIFVSSRTGEIRVENYTVRSLRPRRELEGPDGDAPRSYDITIDVAAVAGLDIEALLDNRLFAADKLTMAGFRSSIVGDSIVAGSERRATPAGVTQPLTEVRPGALITEALRGLPFIEVKRLDVSDASLAYFADRLDGQWLDEPQLYVGLDDLDLTLTGYRSGPSVEFDVSRPLFADGWEASIQRVEATIRAGSHRAQLNRWRSSSAERQMTVGELRLDPLQERREMPRQGGEPIDSLTIRTGQLDLSGVNYGSLIENVDVEIDRIMMMAPSVQVIAAEDGDERESVAAPEVGGRTPAEAISALVVGLPNVRIEQIEMRDAVYERRIDRVDGEWLERPIRRMLLNDLDLEVGSMAHVRGSQYDVERPILSETAGFRLATLVIAPGDGFEELTLTDIAATNVRDDLTIATAHFGPVTTDLPTLVARVQDRTLADIRTGKIYLQGEPVQRYLATGGFNINEVRVESPVFRVYQTARPPSEEAATRTDPGTTTTSRLQRVIEDLPLVQVGRIEVVDGVYERREAAPGYSWEEIPPPVEEARSLTLRVEGLDTDPDRSQRRLLLSERVELSFESLSTPLGGGPESLTLRDFALSSDRDTLTIGNALLTTRTGDGDNDFDFRGIALGNVPYGRIFRALIEPRRGTASIIAAMVDKDLLVDIERIDGRLDDGARTLSFGLLHGEAARGLLRVDGVSLAPGAAVAADDVRLSDEILFDAESVLISGVDFEVLSGRGALQAEALEINTPELSLLRAPARTPSGDGTPGPSRATAPPAASIAAALRDFPVVQLDRLRARDIAVRELTTIDGDPVREFSDVDLAIDGLDLRPDRDPADASGPLYAEDIRVSMPAQRTWINNSVYEVGFGPIQISTGEGSVDLGRVDFVPPYTPEQFLRRTSVREGDRLEVEVGSVSLTGLDVGRWLRDGSVSVDGVRLEDWELQILSDKHKPKNPNPGPAGYPHEALQGLPVLLTVEQVELVNGAVRYSERHREGTIPGHIWWDELNGKLTNLSNDPARMSLETPAVLDVSARMYDAGYLRLKWQLPLLEPGPTMSYTGALSPFEAEHLSEILVPLEGMRITGGVIDQAWFDVDIRGGRATGRFNALYRDLGMRFEDRNTGGRNLGKRLLSFAAGVLMPHNNRDRVGKPAREGVIDWTPAPEDPFFKIFWVAVRTGVLDLVMP